MIRVEINDGLLSLDKHEALLGMKITNALKVAGIPIKGTMTIHTVERGILTAERGDSTHIFRWREDAEDRNTNGFVMIHPKGEGPQHERSATSMVGVNVWVNGRHIPVDDDDEL